MVVILVVMLVVVLVVILVVALVVMLVVVLVVILVVVLFILPPRQAPVKGIHDGALNEYLGTVYIPINVLCGVVAHDYF